MTNDGVAKQRRYYAETAASYESMHVDDADEHQFALAYLVAVIDHLRVTSVLDVGSGTGRAVRYIKERLPHVRVVGVEPVAELRQVGHTLGLTSDELVDGDATSLPFRDGEFDLVCEFAVLHHVHQPERAVREMLRVADKAIFISDSNNFGQGSPLSRFAKQALDTLGLWKVADYVKTKGKGYIETPGDGVSYSYSVFNDFPEVRKRCKSVHWFNPTGSGRSLYRTAGHVTLLGVK